MYKKYDVRVSVSKYPFLRTPRVTIFAVSLKIVAMFIKTTFKDSKKKKVKRIRNYVSKCNLYLYLLYILFPVKEC